MVGYCFQSFEEARRVLAPDRGANVYSVRTKLPMDEAVSRLVAEGYFPESDELLLQMRRRVYEAAVHTANYLKQHRAFSTHLRSRHQRPKLKRRAPRPAYKLPNVYKRRLSKLKEPREAEKAFYEQIAAEQLRLSPGLSQFVALEASVRQPVTTFANTPVKTLVAWRGPSGLGRPRGASPVFVAYLRDVWELVVGSPPTCSNNAGRISGPFHTFCEGAADTMRGPYLQIGSIDSAVQEVCGRRANPIKWLDARSKGNSVPRGGSRSHP